MRLYIFAFIIVLMLSAGLFAYVPQAEAGFGISPPWFRNSHLSPGSHYEQDIYLVQGEPKIDIKVTVGIESDEDIQDWITIKPGKEFIIPKGTQQFPMRVIADIPRDAGYTTYKGHLRIVASSAGVQREGGSGITVQLGALARIDLTVTSEEFSDFKLRGVSVPNIEEEWPIKINAELENLGNVKVRPTRILLTIYDKWHDSVVERGEAKTTDWVNSFEKGTIVATMPTKLSVGNYFADFEIYKGEEIIGQDKRRFHIVESGTIEYWPRFFGISIAWWLGSILSIIAIGVVVIFGLVGVLLGMAGIEVRRKKH